LILCLAASIASFAYLQIRLGEVRRVAASGLIDSGSGMNILLVGSDSRAGLAPGEESFGTAETVSGKRSDVIMIVHTDPARGRASVLSIPRDLWVSIAGTGRSGRINSAYAGGPDRLLGTVRAALGIPIDHYIEVNFDGFRGIVDAIGGLNVPFPAPARDILAELDVPASGCVHLSGRQGLAYVRSRHYESLENGRWKTDPTGDHGRIRRQQDFIRRMLRRSISRGIRNPFVAKQLVDSFVRDVTIDTQLGTLDLLRLGAAFRSVGGGGVEMLTLPTVGARIGKAAVLRAKEPEAAQTVDSFLNPPPPAPAPVVVGPSEVRVQVLNGSGRAGEAGAAAGVLGHAGFVVTGTGDTGSNRNPDSVIRYPQGADGKAALLRSYVVGGAELLQDSTLQSSDLILVTGRAFGGIRLPAAAPEGAPPPPGPSGAAAADCPP
jgi:LCP family protein required for cell wall assembly